MFPRNPDTILNGGLREIYVLYLTSTNLNRSDTYQTLSSEFERVASGQMNLSETEKKYILKQQTWFH